MRFAALLFCFFPLLALAQAPGVQPPPGVPSYYCPTPNGWIDCRCITVVASGSAVTRTGSGLTAVPYQPWLPPGYPASPPQTVSQCPNPVIYDRYGHVKLKLTATVTTPPPVGPVTDGWLTGTLHTFPLPPYPIRIASTLSVPGPSSDPASLDFFFNGFEGVPTTGPTNGKSIIIQPVVRCESGHCAMEAWRCDDGTNCFHSPTVTIGNHDQVLQVVEAVDMTACDWAVGVCPQWRITLLDLNNTTLKTTLVVSENQAMIVALGQILEVYRIGACHNLPGPGSVAAYNVGVWVRAKATDPTPTIIQPPWQAYNWQYPCNTASWFEYPRVNEVSLSQFSNHNILYDVTP